MGFRALAAGFAVVGGLVSGGAQAVTLGQMDDFSSGVAGWTSGAANLLQPFVVASGGPGGAGDAFLQMESNGGGGAGGKLIGINRTQWAGDYLSAGVTAIEMDVRNFGGTDLTLRLRLAGPSFAAIAATAVSLPAGSGWQHVRFELGSAAREGAGELRLFHGASGLFPPEDIVAVLGVDNIAAVPEPAAAALFALGLAALGLRRRF